MAKRVKKPAVRPKIRRQWFRRYEEEGESPLQIAQADGYDVRTVRKQIELERQERERREARSIVLRKALEQHYIDLCAFAQKLDSEVTTGGITLEMLKTNRMWSALRDHLPHSPIWKYLDRWQHIQDKTGQVERQVEKLIQEQIKTRSSLNFATASQEVGFRSGIISVIALEFEAAARGRSGLHGSINFKLTPVGKELTDVELSSFPIGRIPNQQVADAQKLVRDLLDEVTTWEEHNDMCRLLAELQRVERVLHDELAVIILKRVVPGRCKYCPI